MSTSGTYSFGVTRDDIIRQALLNIKRLDPDEVPTAAETNDCARMLNMMCKQWMGKSDFAPGLKVWTRKRGSILLKTTTGKYTIGPSAQGWSNDMFSTVLSSNAAAASTSIGVSSTANMVAAMNIAIQQGTSKDLFYTTISSLGANTVNLAAGLPSTAAVNDSVFFYATAAQNPRKVETALLRDPDNSDTPLNIMTVQSYDMLPNKADPNNVSDPTAIYVEEGLTTTDVYMDCGGAQDPSKRIILTYQEPVQDFVNPLDNPYYPQEWYLALCWGLSEQIAPMFSAGWDEKKENLKMTAIAIARNHNAETSELFFQPGVE